MIIFQKAQFRCLVLFLNSAAVVGHASFYMCTIYLTTLYQLNLFLAHCVLIVGENALNNFSGALRNLILSRQTWRRSLSDAARVMAFFFVLLFLVTTSLSVSLSDSANFSLLFLFFLPDLFSKSLSVALLLSTFEHFSYPIQNRNYILLVFLAWQG